MDMIPPEAVKTAPGFAGAFMTLFLSHGQPWSLRIALVVGGSVSGPLGGLASAEFFNVGPAVAGFYGWIAGLFGMYIAFQLWKRIPTWIDQVWAKVLKRLG